MTLVLPLLGCHLAFPFQAQLATSYPVSATAVRVGLDAGVWDRFDTEQPGTAELDNLKLELEP